MELIQQLLIGLTMTEQFANLGHQSLIHNKSQSMGLVAKCHCDTVTSMISK